MDSNPNAFLSRFYNIPVWKVNGEIAYVNVKNYLATGKDKEQDKYDVWRKLQNFMRHGISSETKKPYQQGEWFVDPRLRPHGRVQYSWAKTLGPFNGKGRPESYARFLQVVDFWLTFGCVGSRRPNMWSSARSLEKFADNYMGVDCNCFVGGFFETNYPQTGWNTSVDWNKNGLKKGKKRMSIDEVKPLDVLVQYKSAKDKHVAVIDDIWGKSGSKASVFISQSANSTKGLWSGTCTLEITGSGKAKTSNGYSCDFDEGVFGVVGANS